MVEYTDVGAVCAGNGDLLEEVLETAGIFRDEQLQDQEDRDQGPPILSPMVNMEPNTSSINTLVEFVTTLVETGNVETATTLVETATTLVETATTLV